MLEFNSALLAIVKILSLNIDVELSFLFLVILTPPHLNFSPTLHPIPTFILIMVLTVQRFFF